MLRDVPDQVLLAELRRRAAEDTVQREEIRRLLAELRLEEIRRQAANAQQLLQDLRERQKLLEGVESLKDVQDGVKPVVESLKDDKPLSAKAHTALNQGSVTEPDEQHPSKKRKVCHWPLWRVKKMGVWPGYEIINTGGSMEWMQAIHGSEFWTFFNGKLYHMRVTKGMHPSDWKEVVGPAYSSDDDGYTLVPPFLTSSENSASSS